MSKKFCFRGPVDKQHVNLPNHCWNLHDSILIKFIDDCQANWVGKSLFFTCQILGLLTNKLDADEEYPVLITDNLTAPIQTQLSHIQKTFSQFFAPFLKFKLNFDYFETKYDSHRFCISEITALEIVFR